MRTKMAALGTKYEDGEIICQQGDEDDHLYVVQSGRVEVVMALSGSPIVIGELGAGEIVGVMALFGGQPHYATVRAKGKARVLALDKRGLLDRVRDDRAFALRLLERLGKRVHGLLEENADLKYGDEAQDTPTLVRPPTPPTNPLAKTRDLRKGLVQRLADANPSWPPPTPSLGQGAPAAATPAGETRERAPASGRSSESTSVADEPGIEATATVDAQDTAVWQDVEAGAQSGSLADRRLHASYRVARALASAVELQDVLDRVLEVLFEVFPEARRGYIVLADSADDEVFRCAAERRRDEEADEGMTVSTGIVRHAMRMRQSVLSVDAASDNRFARRQSVIFHGIRSMMCAPLVFQDEALGAIHIDTGRAGGLVEHFSEDDLALLTSFASQVAMAISNARLHQQRAREQRLVAVGQTVAGLAHCIKNILNGIRGGSYILDRGLEKDDLAPVKRGWGTVKRNNDFLSELVLDMLTLSKDRAPVTSEVDPNQLCREVCQLLEPRAAAAHVALAFQPGDDLGTVQVDEAGIRRCLLNLIGNAVEACMEEQPSDDVEEQPAKEVLVRTALLPDRSAVELAVADNGPGIPDSVKASLFEMFFSTKGNRGTGLGLAVSRKIVEEHRGAIEVESTLGEGTTFRVRLPSRPPEALAERVEPA